MGPKTVAAAGGLVIAACVGTWAGTAVAAETAPRATPATSAVSTSATTGAGTQAAAGSAAGSAAACTRIPGRMDRVTAAQGRLAAGAGSRGSLAWLQDRIAQADQAGRGTAATLLRDRLQVRTDQQKVLSDRTHLLQDAQAACNAGSPAGSGSSTAPATGGN